ncbi:MAG: aminoacyl--tRNA ligase-related protein [Candidatus Paceibacterota bacterium]|jgi:prolyl-tRNA synthetase|nr:His/Gly/Thr/Pro-type tRNA ligase C-terminal domain-containing protein [Candidatus Paceibacterota bacterium]
MKQSQLFTKTRKEAPKDEVSKNAELLIRAGYVHKEMAGVYSYLPLGLRVLNKIENIIREEMNAIGGQEVQMTALQDRTLWEKTDRWDDAKVDNWFKTKLKNGSELGLGFTHEEAITNIMTGHISSYKDLPIYAYQIQNKFRNEVRAKSGIMRGREFSMKDLYSFSATEADLDAFYEKAKQAYKNIFERCGLGDRTFVTFASGGVFSKYSHEFQTLSDAGEDTIYLSREKGIAVNKEVLNDEVLNDLGLKRDELEEVHSIETGNIFKLGTRFSEPIGLHYKNENGEQKPVIMGSYGIGPGRLMGTIVESFADEKGIVWPESIAPFKVHLIDLREKDASDKLYDKLINVGVEVLYDDRDASAGEKFGGSDLLGMPYRVVVSSKTLASGKFEVKVRKSGEVLMLSQEELLYKVSGKSISIRDNK